MTRNSPSTVNIKSMGELKLEDLNACCHDVAEHASKDRP